MLTTSNMFVIFLILSTGLFCQYSTVQSLHESSFNYRVEAGSRACFFEKGKENQTMEIYYQVLDGQHGDLDINFELIGPEGNTIISDYKKPENFIIMELALDGDYTYCMDNSYSMVNSKLVFVSVVVADNEIVDQQEIASNVTESAAEVKEEGILEWTGIDNDGQKYYIEVTKIVDSLTRTLQNVLKSRKLLEMYAAVKSRDSYLAFEDTFIVDVWSGFQISFMLTVGTLQVYMIKKLFNKPIYTLNVML